MDISPSGQKFSPGDSAEPRHTGEKFLIPWVRYSILYEYSWYISYYLRRRSPSSASGSHYTPIFFILSLKSNNLFYQQQLLLSVFQSKYNM